ncbi:MAG: [FeFe] hydrogenase H-cluster maturation GTPase HydF [Spirochaetales bacterium]|nr:[FeFe] hydrogenase H-cluster maturation GTPase HydF [Spirochaetales bacterium]
MSNPQETPLSERLSLVFFGLRNAGKSSLLNAFLGSQTAIVSPTPGTTTDPVTRAFELGELGPVAITDTAGLDDEGDLGKLRVQKSRDKIAVCDVPILVSRADLPPTELEMTIWNELAEKKPALTLVLTHADLGLHPEKKVWAEPRNAAAVDNLSGAGVPELRKLLQRRAALAEREISPLEGLVNENDFLILVTPIDLAAPKGRLILPQVETIRDVLDKDCACLVVKERELKSFYDNLGLKPKLVVCDSQVFSKVASDIPEEQALTSFSILFGRKKGELSVYLAGIAALANQPADAKVLVLEACAHHKQADDIGTVKIPRLFHQLVQSRAVFHHRRDIPDEEELKTFSLVINCAGCMVSRNRMLSRIEKFRKLGIPVINYGLFLAWANGLLPRAILPFPEAEALLGRAAPPSKPGTASI